MGGAAAAAARAHTATDVEGSRAATTNDSARTDIGAADFSFNLRPPCVRGGGAGSACTCSFMMSSISIPSSAWHTVPRRRPAQPRDVRAANPHCSPRLEPPRHHLRAQSNYGHHRRARCSRRAPDNWRRLAASAYESSRSMSVTWPVHIAHTRTPLMSQPRLLRRRPPQLDTPRQVLPVTPVKLPRESASRAAHRWLAASAPAPQTQRSRAARSPSASPHPAHRTGSRTPVQRVATSFACAKAPVSHRHQNKMSDL